MGGGVSTRGFIELGLRGYLSQILGAGVCYYRGCHSKIVFGNISKMFIVHTSYFGPGYVPWMALKVKEELGPAVGLSVGVFGGTASVKYTFVCFDEDRFDVALSVSSGEESLEE